MIEFEFTGVPYGKLSGLMPDLLPYLEKVEPWTKNRASVDDIVKFLYTQQYQLWVGYDKNTYQIQGFILTEIKQYASKRVLVLQFCSADVGSLDLFGDKVFTTLERFAKDQWCMGLEFYGRPGWRNHARKHGCKSETVMYEKFFGE